MSKELLPLGSVIYLEEGSIPLVIAAVGPFVENPDGKDKLYYYDYTGVPCPGGAIGDDIYYFQHENVAEVIQEGYKSESHERYLKSIEEWKEKNKGAFEIGKVE